MKFLDKKIDKTDVIADFDKKDVIDFSKLTGPKLDFIGKDGFSGNGDGEVRYKQFKSAGLHRRLCRHRRRWQDRRLPEGARSPQAQGRRLRSIA